MEKIERFGIIGHGSKMYFERSGVFNLDGKCIEVIYKTENTEYNLTGFYNVPKSVIAYKDAESTIDVSGMVAGRINQFNFGYKTLISVDGVTFNFKPIVKVPFYAPVYINFWLVADTKLDGVLVIKRNNQAVIELPAPLNTGVGGEINWIVG